MRFLKKSLSIAVSSLLVFSLFLVVFNRRRILDEILLYNYSPSVQVQSLADASDMSNSARKIFYVYKPELLSRDDFNKYCLDGEETIVLGCYDSLKIYIFNVNNPQLDGVEEVTAAHEMLHAQYERLSGKERSRVNGLLEKQIAGLNDERIIKNLEAYQKKDPTVVLNEAHSILATEVETLSPELEQYYSQYFNNRKKVVSISSSYEAVFTNLKNQVDDYDSKLGALKIVIEQMETDLSKRADDLTAWSARLDILKNQNKISEYNSQVYSYNSAVEKYRKDVADLRAKVTQYNSMIETRNNLAMQQNTLYQSIDSKAKEL